MTDNDNIKFNNLNSQFLFRKEDFGKSKSKCACTAAKKINPSINLKDLQSLVSLENENIFHEQFWISKTFIINAVDNIKACRYIDNKCITYNNCLIDSGISDTKAHLQMIVPHVTSCYNDSSTPKNIIYDIKLRGNNHICNIRYPSKIEHCIIYGDEIYESLIKAIKDIKHLLEDKDKFYYELKREGNTCLQLTILKSIKKYIVLAEEKNIDKVIEFAVMQYTEKFDTNIQQLLSIKPIDFICNGSKFWNVPQRIPTYPIFSG